MNTVSDSILKTKQYLGELGGPKLIVLGAVHGNESCGPKAIELICEGIESGEKSIRRGAVTFVPISNPQAFEKEIRFVEEDLNRVFRKLKDPITYEGKIANALCALVDEADVLLDIHSTSAPGPTSVFIDFPTDANRALAGAVGAEYALLNWPELYDSNEFFESFDTTRYAFDAGKDGIIVETGQHAEPEAAIRAYLMIMRLMRHLGIIEEAEAEERLPELRSIQMIRLERKDSDNDELTRQWQHLEKVQKDTSIARRADGVEIVAEVDCVMLLPKHHARAGQEWFYLGIEK